ncbi:uncharacterized protein N7496_000723 [Penicillium cataractarum]|uniref:BRCT domain-containing protein n=1 Tax=Penicillium cataractarum TaxID=2100454 RepID=A0A9W9VUU2_9EURO|nr:uncharacterized protein N7496_000723 [Penicillium cataractarum]KAJ5389655.1 hypothetical protein N7496_000723 [Penicillium cataractarum]
MARAAVLPPSPAKRGTRTAPRSTLTKTTASSQAKVVAEPKRRGVTKTTTARKNTMANVDVDSDDTEDELGMMMKGNEERPVRPRGRPTARSATLASTASSRTKTTTTTRPKKTTPAPARPETPVDNDGGDDEASKAEPAKKRVGRPRKNTVPETSTAAKTETAPKARGRPKGSTTSKTTTTTRKNTRAMPEPQASSENALTRHIRIATTMRSNLLRGPAKKKTVTFQEPSDSESDELEGLTAPATGQKKAPAKASGKAGLGATPMRKATGTTTRGRKPAVAKTSVAKPLSPKKDKQVAKSLSAYASSDGEEDELISAKYDVKSPVKLVIHSPVKAGTEVTGLSSPVRRINFTPKKASNLIDENGEPKPATPKNGSSATGLSSPVRKINFTPSRSYNAAPDSGHLALPPGKSVDFSESTFMSSPARRPEASPFQFSLRDTPNRGLLFREDANAAAESNLGQGPPSPLKMSPKKANLGASFSQSPDKASLPFSAKTSLIQSPPKRIPSPFKSSLFSSKSTSTVVSALDGEDTAIVLPIPETQQQSSLVSRSGHHDLAVDEDIQMVEEVARDIFGIELECHGRSSSISPSPQEPSVVEEPLELEPAEDAFDGPEAVDSCAENIDIDEKLQELQEEIRREPEDFGTICFNTMEELQKPFQNLPQVQNLPEEKIVDQNLILDDIDDTMETDMEEDMEEEGEEAEEAAAAPKVPFEEVEQMVTPEEEPEQQSPSHSEQTLGLDALEEAQSPTPTPQILEEYLDLASHAHEDTDETGAEEAESEHGHPQNDEFDLAQDEAAVNVSSTPETPRSVRYAEAVESLQRSAQSTTSLAHTPLAREMSIESPYEQDSAKSKDWLFDINADPRIPAEDSFLDTTLSEIPSPTGHAICDTPNFAGKRKSIANFDIGFTPLASKFDSWETNTPSQAKPARPRRRGVFSLVGPLEKLAEHATPAQDDVSYPDLSRTPLADTPALFAELPLQAKSDDACTPPQSPHTPESAVPQQAHSMIYSPIRLDIFEDPELSDSEEMVPESKQPSPDMEAPESTEAHDEGSLSDDDDKENCDSPVILPATPIRRGIDHLRTVHTVSKVPLKGEGEVSPLKLPRKRGHSLESRSPTRASPRMRKPVIFLGSETVPTFSPHKAPRASRSPSPKRRCSTPRRSLGTQPDIQVPQSPSVVSSAGKTPRRKSIVSQQALQGAVVYVDVHTTEGEDASGIFVELLQQMGARCFRSWSWNPRSSMSPVDGVDPKESKVGITHVVYKDGGLRTLEKVKHAGGLVKCVGVGWVLDCERENKWLDETPYMVDSSIIPRGGAKRRKSMEPRALSNVNGTLVRVPEPSTPSASGRRCGADRGAVEGFRKITPPTPLAGIPSTPVLQSDRYHVPATPGYNFDNLDAIGMSPATPYFLSNRAKLVQQSCPPKQSNRGLFGGAEKPIFSLEQDDEAETRRQQRARMEAARRKSHFYKPSVESPLAK